MIYDLAIHTYQEEGGFTSRCVQLGVASCGDSRDEAIENCHEAVSLYLDTLRDIGELDIVLAERGVVLVDGNVVWRLSETVNETQFVVCESCHA